MRKVNRRHGGAKVKVRSTTRDTLALLGILALGNRQIAESLPRPTGSRARFKFFGSVARQAKRLVTTSAPKPQRWAYSRARVHDGSSFSSSAVLGLSIRKLAMRPRASQRRQRR